MGIWREQKPVIHTEHTIQRMLVFRFYSGSEYMAPNICYRLGEADLLLVRRSGYTEEFEIKITTSDLHADTRKQKKHVCLAQYFKQQSAGGLLPNKFSYVLGPNVNYSNFEFPAYSGLYVVKNGLSCIKSPEFIHKTKCDWQEKIAKSCSFKLLRVLKLSTYG